MKKIFKKNQVIITSLAILIAVAGYLNFTDVDLGIGDKEASTDNSSILDQVEYDLSDETAVADENAETAAETAEVPDGSSTPGEAVLTGASDFAAQAKLSREQVRSQSKADLQEILNNTEVGDEQKQEAVNTMVQMTEISEKEAAAEMLLEAKGFENAIVDYMPKIQKTCKKAAQSYLEPFKEISGTERQKAASDHPDNLYFRPAGGISGLSGNRLDPGDPSCRCHSAGG